MAVSALPVSPVFNIKITLDLTPALMAITAAATLKTGWIEELEEEIRGMGVFDGVDLSGHYNIATLEMEKWDLETVEDAQHQLQACVNAYLKKVLRRKK